MFANRRFLRGGAPAFTARRPLSSPLLIHGDCIAALAHLDASSVDLVVTDPPYVCRFRDRNGRSVAGDDHAAWIAPAFRAIARVMKPDTYCVSFYGWTAIEQFMAAWRGAGLAPVGHLVWHKRYASRIGHLAARHEQAFLLAKGRPPRPSTVLPDVLPWTYTGNVLHPTQKAVEVITPLIEAFSRPGAVVLDPFLGSGTTGVAAIETGRRFIGIELDERHYQTARSRISCAVARSTPAAANDDRVLVYANGVTA